MFNSDYKKVSDDATKADNLNSSSRSTMSDERAGETEDSSPIASIWGRVVSFFSENGSKPAEQESLLNQGKSITSYSGNVRK